MRVAPLVLLLSAALAAGQQRLTMNGATRGLTTSSTSSELSAYANLTNRNTFTVKVYPCFGSLNWYANIGAPATPTRRIFEWEWKEGSKSSGFVRQPATFNSTLGVLFQGLPSLYSKQDVLLWDTTTANPPWLPDAPSSGISSEVTGQGTGAILTWDTTGNSQDSYRLYEYEGEIEDDSGYIDYTPCGVKEFMTDVTTQYDIDIDGSEATATIDGLDPETTYLFKVVVERANGYSDSYNTQIINGAVAVASNLFLSLAALVALS